MMRYSKSNLIERIRKGETLEYLFFWGHQPSADGSLSNSCFSQWWKCEFSDGHIRYCCAEQFMMAAKARQFHDESSLSEILAETDPAKIKQLGRQVKKFEAILWNERKFAAVVEGNFLKFSQNPALREFLLATGNAVIVEASPRDCIWGIGMGKDHPDSRNPEKWRGENLLGFALMEVRDLLRENSCKLSPAEQIVAELAQIGVCDENFDFLTKLRLGDWDEERFAALQKTLEKLRPVFEQLPDAVKILLDLYIDLPNLMLGYIEHSAKEEQPRLYERYFDMLTVMSENTMSVKDFENKLVHWKCVARKCRESD